MRVYYRLNADKISHLLVERRTYIMKRMLIDVQRIGLKGLIVVASISRNTLHHRSFSPPSLIRLDRL
jgi:hypothetical protein